LSSISPSIEENKFLDIILYLFSSITKKMSDHGRNHGFSFLIMTGRFWIMAYRFWILDFGLTPAPPRQLQAGRRPAGKGEETIQKK